MKKIFFVLVALIMALTLINPTPARAATQPHAAVVCQGGPCAVLTPVEIAGLKKGASDWAGLYLSYGGKYDYKYSQSWVRVPNSAEWPSFGTIDLVPSEIRIKRDSFTSIPQMGVYWWKNQLAFYEPGWLIPGEIPTPLPNYTGALTTILAQDIPQPDWTNIKSVTSYAWNGGDMILTWLFVPEVRAMEIVLHILDLRTGFLKVVDDLPGQYSYDYDSPASMKPIPGEELTVIQVGTNSRSVPRREEDGTQNYQATTWRATQQWTDSYVLQRADGSLYRLANRSIIAERACTPEEECYSRTYELSAGEKVYIEPYTLWDIDTEYANIRLSNVNPARPILPADQELINQRLATGEITKVEATVIGPEKWLSTKIIGTDQGTLDLVIHYMPPVGSKVVAYIYKTAPLQGWGVMALFDEQGRLWFFNTEVEYEGTFDATTYNVTAP